VSLNRNFIAAKNTDFLCNFNPVRVFPVHSPGSAVPAVIRRAEHLFLAQGQDDDLQITGIEQSIYEGSFLGRLPGITSRIINPEKLYQTLTGKEKMTDDTFTHRVKQTGTSAVAETADHGSRHLEKGNGPGAGLADPEPFPAHSPQSVKIPDPQ
jgi:hypothetical protein